MPKENKTRVEAFQKRAYRKKIHIRLDDDLHRKLRMKVANEATTIQNYITNLLRRSLDQLNFNPSFSFINKLLDKLKTEYYTTTVRWRKRERNENEGEGK